MSAPVVSKRLVIVGASLAGLRAAEGARASGFTGEIVLIGAEEHLPYDRPPLSKQYLGDAEIPYLRDPDSYVHELNVRAVLGNPVTALRPDEKAVVVNGESISYDSLVIATGAAPRELPGYSEIPGVVTLRNLEDTHSLRRALDATHNITIVGAGIIGAEIATAARKRGCEVTVIEATHYPLERAVGREMGLVLSQMHPRNGTDLRCGVTLAELRTEGEGGKVSSVVLSDGSEIKTDLLLVSIGVVPTTSWLKDSGIELHPDGSIACDEYLKTSLDDVYAAGDAISWPNAHTGRTGRLETWTSANEQGAIAGRNAAGVEDALAYSTVPYFWSDWYGHRIQFAGTAHDAEPEVVIGGYEEEKFVVLYRSGDHVVGALAVNEPAKIMKDRRRIQQRSTWAEAVEHYKELGRKLALIQQETV
ncbi:NAD(P)/FAD-dependent oxidoreductase [Arthrobacter sp. B6]|uniref:NAD(P)/FAD-dependent oxidoreductase n=1 Tax=Arthrobacter sp. B6 TaxID=1570137 RepID=UPI00082CBCA0|nr:FAD-dependent oxidoreductase [Arthrobacter sp. B6]